MGIIKRLALTLNLVSALSAATLPTSAFNLPFTFVENRGQADSSIRYIGDGPQFKGWFRADGVLLQQRDTTVSVTFAGPARLPNPVISPAEPIGASANYLRGNDPAGWQSNLPLFSSLYYRGVWSGIDVSYKAINGRMKAEYLVAPGARVEDIQLRFDGDATIAADGSLHIHGHAGDFIEDSPFIFQMANGKRQEIRGHFHRYPDGCIGFDVADYDTSRPLVVDPSILFSGFSSGGSQDAITALALDTYGNVIVAGWTSSTNLPGTAGARKANAGGVDAFVAGYAPNGGALQWCTYLGGTGDDRAFGVAIDTARNVYVTGWASSANFPVTTGAYQTRLAGTRDAFVTKLTPTGSAIIYSTFLGGAGVDSGNAIALDAQNDAIIAGDTTSTNLVVSARAAQPSPGGTQDAFVAKLSPTGSALMVMTYLGGNGTEHAAAVKVDGSGNIFVGGSTSSANFPVAVAYQSRSGGGQDSFLTKLPADGSAFLFSTYFGGSGGSTGAPEAINGLAIDLLGNVVVAGAAGSVNFPTTPGAYQSALRGPSDGFVARFANNGVLLNSTLLGGCLADTINALALDYHGDVYVTGSTISPDFPMRNGMQVVNNGTTNAFVTKLNPTLSSVVYGTFLGGSSSDSANVIVVDAQTSVTVAGQTSSFDFPVAGNIQNWMPSQLTSFITKLQPNFTIGIDYQSTFVKDPWHISWDTVASTMGNPGDRPIVGDWDGTGKKRIGVFSNGVWYLDLTGDGYFGAGDRTVTFGQAGDIPVVGDWTGSGRIALGLYRNGTFILDLSGHLSGIATGRVDAVYIAFGLAADIPIIADWNGSGTAKVGVFRNGQWLVDYNGDGVFNASDKTYNYGMAGDLPVVGDWDGCGRASKIGVYRSGLWILDYDGDNAWTVPVLNEMVLAFGGTNFTPLIF